MCSYCHPVSAAHTIDEAPLGIMLNEASPNLLLTCDMPDCIADPCYIAALETTKRYSAIRQEVNVMNGPQVMHLFLGQSRQREHPSINFEGRDQCL